MGVEEFFCATFFFSLASVSFYYKGCAGFFPSNLPTPPLPPQKSNGLPLRYTFCGDCFVFSNIFFIVFKQIPSRFQLLYPECKSLYKYVLQSLNTA